jgi:hypothetical protein
MSDIAYWNGDYGSAEVIKKVSATELIEVEFEYDLHAKSALSLVIGGNSFETCAPVDWLGRLLMTFKLKRLLRWWRSL